MSKPAGKQTDADRTSELVGAGPDLFREADGGIELSPEEIRGRNAWHLWTAGNDQFWDEMARISYGAIDLLKTLDSRNRESRFKDLGLINEPGFRAATQPDEFGLWLDEPVSAAPVTMNPKIYGRSSGVAKNQIGTWANSGSASGCRRRSQAHEERVGTPAL